MRPTATKEGDDGGDDGGGDAPGEVASRGRRWAVLAPAAPATARHAGPHGAHRGGHRGGAHRLADAGALGHARWGRHRGSRGGGDTGQLRPVERGADAGEQGQHEHARRDRDLDQRRLPGRRRQQPGRQGRLPRRTRSSTSRSRPSTSTSTRSTRRAASTAARSTPSSCSSIPTNAANMQSLCPQWTQGNPAVFAVVDGIGTWEGDEPALRDPAGPHAADQRVVHRHRLDEPRFALPVVDRARHGARAGRDRAVGTELGSTRSRQEGRRRGLGPGGRPGGAQPAT